MASWPSAKTSASTATLSPSARLAGKRPPSISGVTDSMATRMRPSTSGPGRTVAWAVVGLRLTGARATAKSYLAPPGDVPWARRLEPVILWHDHAALDRSRVRQGAGPIPRARRRRDRGRRRARLGLAPCLARGGRGHAGDAAARGRERAADGQGALRGDGHGGDGQAHRRGGG